ncbi:hypothetical protein [Cognatishimia activa]|uniref:Uncharacterized protein n=1 Tax=Cognatishimia activa TaxID=1715691 RepID=A0A975ER64_9RHOB|nr:hypothetical protein [Cognatishimia activa]QTN36857.1 hypothetical protein HZ995_04895 [Cognatishimia activa]
MIERRPARQVMRLKRLGSLHQCRLSFMRQLTRRMASENWTFERKVFDIDAAGVGHAVYTTTGPHRSYSLVAFAHDLPDDMRSDRVIATAWDTTFALFDGTPTAGDVARLSKNVPFQEAGRISESELTLSRANRSMRLWSHVVSTLADGQQPDLAQIEAVGYLMRTTAVYGSGKFGAADRATYAERSEFQSPFQAELLTVYLIRWFVRDLIEHMARIQGGASAVPLAPAIARQLGIGNSTGLGMAPFLINHPVLFNNWIMAREEAIARVRRIPEASPLEVSTFESLFARTNVSVARWRSEHPIQVEKLADLRRDLGELEAKLADGVLNQKDPWNSLYRWSEENLSEEGQELVASLMLEAYPELTDGLASCMTDAREDALALDGSATVAQTRGQLETAFGWAKEVDWQEQAHCARAWYVSEEKLEPRLGERFQEPIADYEQPLAPARDAVAALKDLENWTPDAPIAEFLETHPEHRHTVRRAQVVEFAPYSEIQDNTISSEVMPIDMLRAKLSFFGATHFDPRSDRWVRICMYAGAPYPEELTSETSDLWVYPEATP